MPIIDIMPMPVYWSSYLINGDASSLVEGEKAHIDDYLENNGIKRVLGITEGEEQYFSWSYDLYGGQFPGGELIKYDVEFNT